MEKITNFQTDQKKFVQNWPKVGNYFKTCWFLGKVELSENTKKSNEKLFKFLQIMQEIVHERFFYKDKAVFIVIFQPFLSYFSFKNGQNLGPNMSVLFPGK